MVVLDGDPDSGWRVVRWSSEPLGGPDLVDGAAHDITGDGADEALQPTDRRPRRRPLRGRRMARETSQMVR